MTKALIFDFDGLLFDTEPVWDKTHFNFLKLKNFPDMELGDTTGIGLRDFIVLLQKNGLGGETDQLLAEYRKIFYGILEKKKDILMPGALETLKKAAAKGLTIALTSGGHTQVKLKEIMKRQKILDYFSVIVSSDDVSRGKPAPDVYLESLKQLNPRPNECLALEDSVNGVVAAKTTGIPVYGINTDYTWRNDLIKAGANRVFGNLSEVDL